MQIFKIVRHKFFLLTLFLSVIHFVYPLMAQDFPAVPNRLVTDYTNTLTASEIDALERKLLAFEDTTSTQIAVVLMNSTGDYEISDYADRLAQQWGVGSKKYNNGIMLLAAIGDRAVTIRTGYGIEGAVPDVVAYRIIENEIKPAFRNNDYYGGLDKATSALISHTKGEYNADPKRQGNQGSGGGVSTLLVVIIVFIIIALISKGGGGGGRGGKVVGGRGSSDLWWWTLMNSGGGSRGGDGGFGGGFGGGGGGFGGFGGGGFGGGGASGRW